jgi:hypothetical protein
MERNALLYAFSPSTVVCHSRFREGGTWHGAIDAHRRRTTSLIVRDDGSPASRAFVALGAVPLGQPSDLAGCLQPDCVPSSLFALG